jgi:hypothetical protein
LLLDLEGVARAHLSLAHRSGLGQHPVGYRRGVSYPSTAWSRFRCRLGARAAGLESFGLQYRPTTLYQDAIMHDGTGRHGRVSWTLAFVSGSQSTESSAD